MIIDCTFYKDPKVKMIFLLENRQIPDELSPAEVEILADLVMDGAAGDGWKRKQKLGRWYGIIQAVINDRTYVRKGR